MARMHSRTHGKSGSTRPYRTEPQSWIQLDNNEITELVIKLYKQGNTQASIGTILRDQHGIPSIKLKTGMSLLEILKNNEVAPATPEDLLNLIRRALNLRNHLSENKKDLSGKHGLRRIESKIYRLSRYYRDAGVLPEDWRYRPDSASILLR
ncbi:MAG: 30S ribosomal protein S15 [Candidatus Heimdallarchaeota archaeon]|nr:30S ribosomal protein S15 [Candidatus Heimdallarchaeota archaeon]